MTQTPRWAYGVIAVLFTVVAVLPVVAFLWGRGALHTPW